MRIAVGLLACLAAGALTSALADPTTEAVPATTATTVAVTPAADTATQVITAKADLDKDTQHFLAEGYKPEMRGGERVYCRKETALGSRLSPVKNCGTIEQLKLAEKGAQSGVSDQQRKQAGTTTH